MSTATGIQPNQRFFFQHIKKKKKRGTNNVTGRKADHFFVKGRNSLF